MTWGPAPKPGRQLQAFLAALPTRFLILQDS